MDTVIFDMDGVLFDTERLCMESWCRVAKQQGIADMEAVFPKCIGTNATDTRRILEEYYGEGFPYEDFMALAGRAFKEEIERNGISVKAGVRELLQYLQETHTAIGLASSTRRRSVESHLERAGIRSYFRELVTGDMIVHSKPQPEIYLLACEKMGVLPQDAYAIEDSFNGIRSAYRAGMKAVMVPDLIAPDAEMERMCVRICKDLLEVKAFLEQERG